MTDGKKETLCVYPAFRYREAVKMMDWLCAAFGFRVLAKYMSGDELAHCELALGASIIMLGQVKEDEHGRGVGAPGSEGGKSIYVAVADVEAAFERAKAAGATILRELVDRDYGSREFACADPEGNVWSFGTYGPEGGVG